MQLALGSADKFGKSVRWSVAIILVAVAGTIAVPAYAKAKPIARQKVEVDGQSFRVISYDNGSVKVVDGGMFGDGVSFNLRERMRKAAQLGTGCDISDDFWLDGKLIGKLACSGAGGQANGQ